MSESDSDPKPPGAAALADARRRSRNVTIATICGSLAILPMVWGAKAVGLDPSVAVWSWVGVLGLGAAVYPWRQYASDLGVIREAGRIEARTKLGLADTPAAGVLPEAPADPLQAMADRVVQLAGGDDTVKRLVKTVMGRRTELLHDLESLESAIAMEAALDDPGGRRHARLTAVADARKADLQSLTDALRDLHVELTVQKGTDPTEAVQRMDHLLASLSAETELVALGSTDSREAEAPRRRPHAERQT